MIPVIRAFVADLVERRGLPDPVVEFGALQVEADQDADLRPLFAGRPYLGTDMRPGPGVDRVEDLRRLGLGDGEVGTALCLETLEHCEDPIAAARELTRVVRPDGGVCVLSVPMLLGIHGHPNDYFRFTPEGVRVLLGGFDDVAVVGVGDPDIPMTVLGVGVRGGKLGVELAALPSVRTVQERWERAEGMIRIGPLRIGPRELAGTVAREGRRIARARLSRRLG